MAKGVTHKDSQKEEERFALQILTNELRIPCESLIESEGPDFMFSYEGKRIGAEVVEYHRNPKETEARKAYQKSIDKYKGKKGKLTSVVVFDEDVTTFNGKKSGTQLLNEIDSFLQDRNYDGQYLQGADEWELESEMELPVSVCSVGESQHVKSDILEKIIRDKEKKLIAYKNSHKEIDEFWLIVYVNMYEYDYFENMDSPMISSSYDKIYLTHMEDKVLRIK